MMSFLIKAKEIGKKMSSRYSISILVLNMVSAYWLSFVIQLVNVCYKFVNICCPASCTASCITHQF